MIKFFKTEKEYKDYVENSCDEITDRPEQYPCIGLERAYYDESTGFTFLYKADICRIRDWMEI